MTNSFHYRINEKKIAHEVVDGEAIIIHFDSGNYYSLNGMASQLWELIAGKATYQQILGVFQQLSPQDLAALDFFLDGLITEGILERVEGEPSPASDLVLPANRVFVAPTFEKFNDMQQLLLSDPIHEVDETGWPHPQPEAKE